MTPPDLVAADPAATPGDTPSALLERYRSVRALTEELAAPLSPEDQTIQSMPDVSPTKWHRAHTTWFFETFVLETFGDRLDPAPRPFDPAFRELFNSYYEGVGPQFPRAARGLLSRPGAAEVGAYRSTVDVAVEALLADVDAPALAALVELGCHHEQQHQELLLMDIAHVLSVNPLRPTYRFDGAARSDDGAEPATATRPLGWLDVVPAGPVEVGHDPAEGGFHFDNEAPRHRVWLEPFSMADRLVTAGEWRAFIADGGYARPELWLSDGWHTVRREGWDAPLYWVADGEDWLVHTLGGTRPVVDAEPVTHVSHYEADAFARWSDHQVPGTRLATEAEWETAVRTLPTSAPRPFDLDALHPRPVAGDAAAGALHQAFGECWQWTASSYLPYPGYRPPEGAVGEYNGKFMSGQMVLRGSSSYTPPGHARVTYRNFFPPQSRWMRSGVRLAKDLSR